MTKLIHLLNSVFTAASIRSYAEIVQEKSLLRRMIKTTEELTESYYLGKEDTRDLLEKTEKRVFNLLEKRKAGANRCGRDLEAFFGKLFALRSEDTQGNGK